MSELSQEEIFILKILKDKGTISYGDLQKACENEFEGVRLILKKMKERGLLEYEGVIPGFNSEITLVREPEFP